MDAVEKIFFAFSAYDFDSRGSISYDEAILLYRSVVTGLTKASPTTAAFQAVSRADTEKYASLVFTAALKDQSTERVGIEQFKDYSVSHPIISNWLKSLSNLETSDVRPTTNPADETLRNEWLLPLVSAFRSASFQARLRTLELKDIEVELHERDQEDDLSSDAASSPVNQGDNKHEKISDQAWIFRVDKSKPEEIPPVRTDIPEDLFDPFWIGGINVRRNNNAKGITIPFSSARIHRSARYASIDNNTVLYSTGTNLIVVKKQEETNFWMQQIYNEHELPISAFDIHYKKNIIVSVDSSSPQVQNGQGKNRLVVWDAINFTVKKIIQLSAGVKFLDLNANGSLALIVLEDLGNTLHVYDLNTGFSIFSKKLLLAALADTIHDARFFGTSSMIAIASEKIGMTFYVDEESGLMGKSNMHLYEERHALYGAVGKSVKGSAFTELSRLEMTDEIASGNDRGQITIWRGRTVSQVIDAHSKAITALDYNPTTKTLLSAAADGTIKLFDLVDNSHRASTGSKGPRLPATRTYNLTATFDILSHAISGYHIASAVLSSDATKAVVTTSTNDLIEVKCKIRQPTAEELQEAAEAAENPEGGVPGGLGKLGDDINTGPIVTSHFVPEYTTPTKASPVITSLTRFGGNGFISTGSDQTIRIWQTIGEGETATGYKVVKTIPMDSGITSVSSSSQNFAVALNGAGNATRLGSIHIFGLPEYNFLNDITDIKVEIRELRFAPEGTLLIAHGTDGIFYIFERNAESGAWGLKGKLPSDENDVPYISDRFDLSADNQFLRVYYPTLKNIKIFDIGANFGKELFSSAEHTIATLPPPENPEEALTNPAFAIYEPIRSIAWSTNFAPYQWDTAGCPLLVQPAPKDSPVPIIYDRSNSLLVGSTAEGLIQITRAPVYFKRTILKDAYSNPLVGHIGAISGLFFLDEGNSKLVSAGAHDGIIRVWKVTYDADEPEPDLGDAKIDGEGEEEKQVEEEEGEDGEKKATLPPTYDSGDEEDLYDLQKLKEHLTRVPIEASTNNANNNKEGENEDENAVPIREITSREIESIEREGPILAKYISILGFANANELSKISAKSFNKISPTTVVPKEDLSVDWVYGSTVRPTRNAVRFTGDSLIVYPAGCLAVIFDKVKKKQIYTPPHRDVISALDIHTGKNIGATAHLGAGNIFIHIWKISDGSILRVIDCGAVNGISALKFSPDGQYLIAAAQDIDHTVHMYNVDDGVWLASVRGGGQKILAFAFSDIASGPNLRIIQGGIKHYKLLTYNTLLRTFQSKTGLYGADVRKSHMISVSSLPLTPSSDGGEEGGGVSYSGNEFILGFSDGSVGFIARGENKIGGFTPIQRGGITALTVARLKAATAEEPPVYKIIIGGVSGAIKVLDQELQVLQEYNLYLQEELYGLYQMGRVRGFKSLAVDKANRKILYATSGNEIGEIDLINGEDLNNHVPIVTGHFRDQLLGLCAHPLRQECLTAGNDKTLRVWDLETHSLITMVELPGNAISATFSPNGHLIVVGLSRKVDDTFGGRMAVVSYLQGKTRIVYITNDAKDEIQSLVFSPDGSKVYVASLDSVIYIYDALNNFQLLGQLTGHTEGIRSIDISSSGQYLISESILNDVRIFDLNTKSMISRGNDRYEVLHDVQLNYHVRQNRFGINSIGLFATPDRTKDSVEEDVNSLHQSNNQKLLVAGTSRGFVKLYNNPATELNAPYKNYLIHSPGGVSRVQFTSEDRFVLSVGQYDKILVQWKITTPPAAATLEDITLIEENSSKRQLEINKAENFIPEDIFESSFIVKNISLADPSKTWKALPTTTLVQLSDIIGVGNHRLLSNPEEIAAQHNTNVNAVITSPASLFCGHGEIVTVLGKNVTLLEGSNHQNLRVWNQAVLHTPTLSISDDAKRAQTLDVSSIAVSANGRYVAVGYIHHHHINPIENRATGTVASPLHLYSAPHGELITELSPNIDYGVQTIAFSYEQAVIAALGRDPNHSIYIYQSYTGQWNDAFLLYTSHINILPVTLLSFLTPTNHSTNFSYDFVSAGKGKLQFWKLMNHSNVITDTAVYDENISTEKEITALAGLKLSNHDLEGTNYAISGDIEGNVLLWKGPSSYEVVANFENTPIHSIYAYGQTEPQISTSVYPHVRAGFIVGTKDGVYVYSVAGGVSSASAVSMKYSFHYSDLFSQLASSPLASHYSLYAKNPQLAANLRLQHVVSDVECRQVLLSLSNGVTLSLATDSGNTKPLLEGHSANQHEIYQIASPPATTASAEATGLVATISSDKTIRLFRLSNKDTVTSGIAVKTPDASVNKNITERSGLVAYHTLDHQPTALTFANDHILLVAIDETDTQAKSGAILIIDIKKEKEGNQGGEYTFTVLHKLHNIGKGRLHHLRFSNDLKHFIASSQDGNVYLYGISGTRNDVVTAVIPDVGQFFAVGYLLAHPSGAPVIGADFSDTEPIRYIRTFGQNLAKWNGKVEMNIFDLETAPGGTGGSADHVNNEFRRQAGGKIQDVAILNDTIRPLKWSSVSSPAAPEARGLSVTNDSKQTILHVESITVSPDERIVAAGYHNGLIRVFR